MKKIEKQKEISKKLPLFWSSYQHMYDARENTIRNNTNFLLVVVSFLPLLSISLFTYFNSEIFLISVLFQIIAFFILIKSFFIKKHNIPWLELNSTLKNIENEEFDICLFASLKALENDTHE